MRIAKNTNTTGAIDNAEKDVDKEVGMRSWEGRQKSVMEGYVIRNGFSDVLQSFIKYRAGASPETTILISPSQFCCTIMKKKELANRENSTGFRRMTLKKKNQPFKGPAYLAAKVFPSQVQGFQTLRPVSLR